MCHWEASTEFLPQTTDFFIYSQDYSFEKKKKKKKIKGNKKYSLYLRVYVTREETREGTKGKEGGGGSRNRSI